MNALWYGAVLGGAMGVGLGFALLFTYLESLSKRQQMGLRHDRETAAMRILTDGVERQNELTRMLLERVFRPMELTAAQTREAAAAAAEEEQTHENRTKDATELLEGIASDGVDVTGVT